MDSHRVGFVILSLCRSIIISIGCWSFWRAYIFISAVYLACYFCFELSPVVSQNWDRCSKGCISAWGGTLFLLKGCFLSSNMFQLIRWKWIGSKFFSDRFAVYRVTLRDNCDNSGNIEYYVLSQQTILLRPQARFKKRMDRQQADLVFYFEALILLWLVVCLFGYPAWNAAAFVSRMRAIWLNCHNGLKLRSSNEVHLEIVVLGIKFLIFRQ